MNIKILCTLGPASLNPDVIKALGERGVTLFRINLSHTPSENVPAIVDLVRRYSSVPVCIDTQGAQIRCGAMAPGVALEPGDVVQLTSASLIGTATELTLWPGSALATLQVGAKVGIDFDGVVLEVQKFLDPGRVQAVVQEGGRVRSNRAVIVDPPVSLPPLTGADMEAVEMGRRLDVEYYALSFASNPDDVAFLRSLMPADGSLMSKIESRAGVRNMDGIISASDAVIIDRGDLAKEVPIEYVPFYQKAIVRRANRWNKPAFVATNLLESMVTSRRPTVAEANDIANTLLDGVHGLVLAAETAVGIDPVGTVDMIARAIVAFERAGLDSLLEEEGARHDSQAIQKW